MKIRIEEVRIEHAIDEDPNTEDLGKFTDDMDDNCIIRNGEFQGETVGTLKDHIGEQYTPEEVVPGKCKCGGNTTPNEHDDWDCALCGKRVPDDWQMECGFPYTHEYRFFLPAQTGEETGNPDSPKQDWKRMEDLYKGEWSYIGIIAKAKIILPSGTIQTIHSGGIWGIESDSEHSYIKEEEQNQLADLKQDLLALGIGERAIDFAFKKIKHS